MLLLSPKIFSEDFNEECFKGDVKIQRDIWDAHGVQYNGGEKLIVSQVESRPTKLKETLVLKPFGGPCLTRTQDIYGKFSLKWLDWVSPWRNS